MAQFLKDLKANLIILFLLAVLASCGILIIKYHLFENIINILNKVSEQSIVFLLSPCLALFFILFLRHAILSIASKNNPQRNKSLLNLFLKDLSTAVTVFCIFLMLKVEIINSFWSDIIRLFFIPFFLYLFTASLIRFFGWAFKALLINLFLNIIIAIIYGYDILFLMSFSFLKLIIWVITTVFVVLLTLIFVGLLPGEQDG